MKHFLVLLLGLSLWNSAGAQATSRCKQAPELEPSRTQLLAEGRSLEDRLRYESTLTRKAVVEGLQRFHDNGRKLVELLRECQDDTPTTGLEAAFLRVLEIAWILARSDWPLISEGELLLAADTVEDALMELRALATH